MSEYGIPEETYNPYDFSESADYITNFAQTAKEKVQNIKTPQQDAKKAEQKEKEEEVEKQATLEEPPTLPEGYRLSSRNRNGLKIVTLMDADGTSIKTYTAEPNEDITIKSMVNTAINYAIDRDQLRKDAKTRENYKEAIPDAIESIDADIKKLEDVIYNADLTTTEGQGAYFASQERLMMLNEQLLTLTLLNQQLDTKVKNKDGEEEDKWGLKDIGMILALTASGISLGDSLVRLFEDDDIANVDVAEEIRKAIEIQTDPATADAMINSAYRDMPRLTDLENLSAFRNQFGSFAGDYFNDPQIGSTLEDLYQDFLVDNPDMSRDQFLAEYANANPTDPLSQQIQFSMSRMGQLAKSTDMLRDINTRDTIRGFRDAQNFYKPLNEGGMGFRPDDFRSQEQKDIVASAMGLVNNPDMQMLKDSVGRRVRQQGKLGTDELRDITNASLTSVDPSLQNQAYLRSGGLARSILNTSGAMRNRLVADEKQYAGLMDADRANVTTANNVVTSNSVNPVEAFGLRGTNTSLANQIYSTNPTTSLNYDPTSQYFSSMAGINAGINQANAMTPSLGTKATDVSNSANSFIDNWKQYTG